MDFLDPIAQGLAAGFRLESIAWIVLGVVIGITLGAAPGIGATVGIALVLPITLRIPATEAVFLMVSILVGSSFGNSIPAVLVKIPGGSAALLTVAEGNPLQRRGEGGKALIACLTANVLGQAFGVILFILFVIPLAAVAVHFLFPEVFALVVFGLLTAATLIGRDALKGLMAVGIGLLLGMVGTDFVTGQSRLTFGVNALDGGFSDIAVLVGILALRQVLLDFRFPSLRFPRVDGIGLARISRREFRQILRPIGIGAVAGTLIGILPGNGGTVSTFVAYRFSQLTSKHGDEYGKGSLEGLAAVDSANSGAQTGELIPTLALGIPGTPAMVLLMAALLAQGIVVGPQLLKTQPELLYATFGGLMASVIVLAVAGYLVIGPSVFISSISRPAVLATTFVLILLGVYVTTYSVFDLVVCVAAGSLGYVMTRGGFPVLPTTLAFILGPIAESSLRRGLIMTDGIVGFVTRPVAALLLSLAVASILAPLAVRRWRTWRATRPGAGAAPEA